MRRSGDGMSRTARCALAAWLAVLATAQAWAVQGQEGAGVTTADWTAAVSTFDKRLQPFRSKALQRARDQALLDVDLSATPLVIYSETPRVLHRVTLRAEADPAIAIQLALPAQPDDQAAVAWRSALPAMPAGRYWLEVDQSQAEPAVLVSPLFKPQSTAAEWRVNIAQGALTAPTPWAAYKSAGLLRRAASVLPWVSAPEREAVDDRLPPTLAMLVARCRAGRWDVLGEMLARADLHALPEPPPAMLQCALQTGAIDFALEHMLATASSTRDQQARNVMAMALAKTLLQRGHAEQSIAVAQAVASSKHSSQRLSALELISRAHLLQGEANAAIQLLDGGPHLQSDLAVLDQPAEEAVLIAVLRINHAIARLRLGDTDAGYALLDLVGRSPSTHVAVRRLADHANVMLGWELLRQKQGRAASAALGRVSMRSPSTAMALLGQGWARLAPPGQRPALQTVALTAPDTANTPDFMLAAKYRLGEITCEQYRALVSDDFVSCAQRRRLDADRPASDEQQQANRALTPWAMLTERKLPGFASIEAAIAMGDVLGSRQATQQAQHYYQAALATVAAHMPTTGAAQSNPSKWLDQRWQQHGAAQASQALLDEVASLREWHGLPDAQAELSSIEADIRLFRAQAVRQTRQAAQDRLNTYAIDARFKLARLYDAQS